MQESERSKLEEVVRGIIEGRIKLHEADKILGNANAGALARRLALEKMLGVSLSSIGSTILDFEELVGRNIENPIGAVQIPVGIVGPLRVRGDYANGDYYVPMATTEGALVASVNRGAKAITLSGGARAKVLRDGMARAPVFWTPGIEEAARFVEWVREHMDEVRREAESTTRHGKLLEVQPFITGNLVWLRFVYETGDAMGMNMATIATDKAAEWILANYPGTVRLIALSGNMCTDKKPALLNMLFGRGKTVVAEAVIKRDVALKVLKARPEEIDFVNRVKNLLGTARAGSFSLNAHFANIIAAIFIATGQDVAQVVESSMGYTWTEVRNGDLYISVTLPSLEVGTVGGGTRLPTQREALALMGVAGGGDPPGSNARKFAEIVAATVLAGELNLLAALAANELARAHKLLGRGEARKEKNTANSKPTN
ncbi:hydroxymethylglutaryl-CoA reductase (NADPH) [Hyperthermus butylicus]|uniref:3-hydroxy-3-methylglutaryl coenzyme A reductase n=1 Tax=Hyperthermus butylicus (strain DSM 5456 / JCM 9403 / PLM1-5) TaxID=415426 RepID=A2BMZ2_HYPBU|nr:hydroxymethylglutaryl-CoA reductase (NADPH) [Hyperthermus butylicus]ABM81353.1 3-hydroxy-3-methylglutaryl-coenzyme A reductase [Hyperthermus butylicus DSM 5456]